MSFWTNRLKSTLEKLFSRNSICTQNEISADSLSDPDSGGPVFSDHRRLKGECRSVPVLRLVVIFAGYFLWERAAHAVDTSVGVWQASFGSSPGTMSVSVNAFGDDRHCSNYSNSFTTSFTAPRIYKGQSSMRLPSEAFIPLIKSEGKWASVSKSGKGSIYGSGAGKELEVDYSVTLDESGLLKATTYWVEEYPFFGSAAKWVKSTSETFDLETGDYSLDYFVWSYTLTSSDAWTCHNVETDTGIAKLNITYKAINSPITLSLRLRDSSITPKGVSGNSPQSEANATEVASSSTVVTASIRTVSGNPLEGKTVQFSSEPQERSGGHNHQGGRPSGIFDSTSCITDSDGVCSVTFFAPEFGGIEKISGAIMENPLIKDSKDLTIKVSGLVPLGGGPYTFKCSIDSSNPGCPAGGYQHTNFYYVKPVVDESMFVIASLYNAAFPDASLLTVTDASLLWGGLYDYKNTWGKPHTFHRTGMDVDLRSKNIPMDNQGMFEKIVCRFGGYPKLEFPALPNEHYHLYFHAYREKIIETCNQNE